MKPMSFMQFDTELKKPLPPKDDQHDVIILPKNAVAPRVGVGHAAVQRFKINRATGRYLPPEELPAHVSGGRKARSLGAPGEGYGPGISLAPTRPEPAAQNGTCIIVNQQHLRICNAWTAARLDNEPPQRPTDASATVPDEPDIYREKLPLRDQKSDFEMLVASGQGKVFLVKSNAEPEPLDLTHESEIWYQLRNGFVAGSVYCEKIKGVLPMVNVLSLVKVQEEAPVNAEARHNPRKHLY